MTSSESTISAPTGLPVKITHPGWAGLRVKTYAWLTWINLTFLVLVTYKAQKSTMTFHKKS